MVLGTVSHRTADLVMPLNGTSIAFTLRRTHHVNDLTSLEYIRAKLLPNFVSRQRLHRAIHGHSALPRCSLSQRDPVSGFVARLAFLSANPSWTAVYPSLSTLLLLKHHARARFNHRHRHDMTFLVEDLCHTEFSARESLSLSHLPETQRHRHGSYRSLYVPHT